MQYVVRKVFRFAERTVRVIVRSAIAAAAAASQADHQCQADQQENSHSAVPYEAFCSASKDGAGAALRPDYDLSMFGFFSDDSWSISTLLANFA